MPRRENSADPAAPPVAVAHPVMKHSWETLTFLHWRYDAETIQRLLPPGLEVETCDGSGWVGLVPFFMRVAAGVGPSVPWATEFCETNVRTYVRDGSGRSGVWFFSLDAARLGPVVAARASFRLPYFWSRMRLAERTDQVAYSCVRRWPGPDARSRVIVSIGSSLAADELGALEHFLTARWLVFSVVAGQLVYTQVEHEPWPLHRAVATTVEDELVAAAGLPAPVDPPLVHFSPGVSVSLGRPRRTGQHS